MAKSCSRSSRLKGEARDNASTVPYLKSETGSETTMCELHARSVLGFSAGHRLGVELENPLLGSSWIFNAFVVLELDILVDNL